eukprot:1536479-Pleurochrysis_carterae.AAC.11
MRTFVIHATLATHPARRRDARTFFAAQYGCCYCTSLGSWHHQAFSVAFNCVNLNILQPPNLSAPKERSPSGEKSSTFLGLLSDLTLPHVRHA